MVNVKELRIGNYLSYKNSIFTIELLGKNPVDFDPITLTSDILEKCGFKKAEYAELGYFKECIILISVDKGITYHFPSCLANIEVKSLHQLQNLYFALTGKELNCDKISA